MLLGGTIRRKMVFGLTLIVVMLVTLSLSGISGLLAYRDTVRDLDFRIEKMPANSELTVAFAALAHPLLLKDASPAYRRAAFAEQLRETTAAVSDFRRKLIALPRRPDVQKRREVTETQLLAVDEDLRTLRALQRQIGDHQAEAEMHRILLRLDLLANNLPDNQVGLLSTLEDARRAYHTRFWWVGATSAVAAVLFLWLMRYAYQGVFHPLRKLHQGASRVAQGDFNYRLKMNTADEMEELAESFNRMTDRFQEIAGDLDRQVRARTMQLVRSERLAGIGFLAAGVAHEINNPLSAIGMAAESLRGRTEMLCRTHPEDAELIRDYLEMIVQEADRCQGITRRLLEFARGQDASRSDCNLTQIVQEVRALVQHMSKFRDRTIVFERDEPCWLEINGPEIKQVVLNIVANALEAMDPGGELRIDLASQVDGAVLTFKDNGCGMSEEVIQHLFDPFFTRRRDGKGTGLGMAISHRIVVDHGGTIEATSAGPQRGSTFRIHLPRKAAEAAAERAA